MLNIVVGRNAALRATIRNSEALDPGRAFASQADRGAWYILPRHARHYVVALGRDGRFKPGRRVGATRDLAGAQARARFPSAPTDAAAVQPARIMNDRRFQKLMSPPLSGVGHA
jgi:hypothetical protein